MEDLKAMLESFTQSMNVLGDWATVPILMLGAAGFLTGIVVGIQNFGREDETREALDQGGGVEAFAKGELASDAQEAGPYVGHGFDIWEERDGTVRGRVKTQVV